MSHLIEQAEGQLARAKEDLGDFIRDVDRSKVTSREFLELADAVTLLAAAMDLLIADAKARDPKP